MEVQKHDLAQFRVSELRFAHVGCGCAAQNGTDKQSGYSPNPVVRPKRVEGPNPTDEANDDVSRMPTSKNGALGIG